LEWFNIKLNFPKLGKRIKFKKIIK